MQVKRIVHAIHVVRDLRQTRQRYMNALGAWVFAESYHEGEDRDMNLLYVANFMMEPMSPRGKPTGLTRFLERYDEGLHSIEFEVDDLSAAKAALTTHGIRSTDITGSFFFARPKDTFGVLLEVTTARMPNDPIHYEGWNPRWSVGHPSSLLDLASLNFVVEDLDGARGMLTDVWGGVVIQEGVLDGPEPVDVCHLAIADGVVCLARPQTTTGPIGRWLAERGPGFYSITWRVASRDAAEASFIDRGLSVLTEGTLSGGMSIDPSGFFGARHEFVEGSTWAAAPN